MTTATPQPGRVLRPPPAGLGFTTWSRARASLISGIALAAIAVLGAFGNFGAVTPLVVPGDAAATARHLAASQPLFLTGIACLFCAALLDVLVAGAWYALFKSVNPRLSAVAALLRVVFAAVFIVAIVQLVRAILLVARPEEALRATAAFTTIWVTGLGLFGIHLLLIGYLAYRSGFVPRVFGVLLAIAGVGYLADAVGVVLVPGFTARFAQFLFVGEVAIIFWLLIRGRRLPDASSADHRVPDGR